MLLNNTIWLGTSKEHAVCMLPQMANRHGLITGATGTGKTVTLQVMAEGFSQLGVPVFMADIKGDLSGMARPGVLSDKVQERLTTCGIQDFPMVASPVTFWDVYGEQGHPVRTTVSEMGPLLLARMLQLNETQSGVLHLIFRIADDQGLLLIDLKDIRAMLNYVGEHTGDYTIQYGNITKASIGAIQRALAILEDQGGDVFFGEPALDLRDWFAQDDDGKGMINILAADRLFQRPAMYSSFMLWLLSELYELLPEKGDSSLPNMVFFFDEAHLLFDDCPKALMDKLEQVIRLIRSKGVGVFFITQNPVDVPSSILSQLSGRVQHSLRAFTPVEQRAVRAAAQTFRANPAFDTEQAITSLATGEALLSFLTEDGTPSMVERATILPPQSSIGRISPQLRKTFIDTSAVSGKYDTPFDRESAYEALSTRAASQGIAQTRVMQSIPQAAAPEGAPEGAAAQPAPVTFRVYNAQTGDYDEKQATPPVYQMPQFNAPAPAPSVQTYTPPQPAAQPLTVQGGQPPVLVYNPATGQYEPQQAQPQSVVQKAVGAVKKTAQKVEKEAPSTLSKMFTSFTRSIASGSGRQLGSSLTRSILGTLGLNKR